MTVCMRDEPAASIVVREAGPSDNQALLALEHACQSLRRPAWSIHHEPDVFALFRVAGVRAWIGIAETDTGAVAGMVTVAKLPTMDDDGSAVVGYVTGWEVDPACRGRGTGLALARWARQRCAELDGGSGAAWSLHARQAGDARERLLRKVPSFQLSTPRPVRCMWLRTRTWRSLIAPRGLEVRPAVAGDAEEMADCWRRAARARRVAPRLDAAGILRWQSEVLCAPPACYWVARSPGGTLLGFVGLWDQRNVKQFRAEPTPLVARMARAVSRVAPSQRTADRPGRTGAAMACLAATHFCIAPGATGCALGLLVRAAHAAWLGGYVRIGLMVDAADPIARLCAAWDSSHRVFSAHHSGVWASDRPDREDHRPLHFEYGLV